MIIIFFYQIYKKIKYKLNIVIVIGCFLKISNHFFFCNLHFCFTILPLPLFCLFLNPVKNNSILYYLLKLKLKIISYVPKECSDFQELASLIKAQKKDRLLVHNHQQHFCFDPLHLILYSVSERYILSELENYYQTNFPVNSDGKTCSYDLPEQPYLYFSNPNDLS